MLDWHFVVLYGRRIFPQATPFRLVAYGCSVRLLVSSVTGRVFWGVWVGERSYYSRICVCCLRVLLDRVVDMLDVIRAAPDTRSYSRQILRGE